MPNHVHLLVSLPPTACVATFTGQMKGVSSRLFKMAHGGEDVNLLWQEGYGVVTLRKGGSRKVTGPVLNDALVACTPG